MKPTKILSCFLLSFLLCNCESIKLPKAETLGEENSSYSYVPIDPFPVSTVMGNSCLPCQPNEIIPYKTLLNSFPDQTVRLSVAKLNTDGSITYGSVVKATAKNETYEVTLDYVNVDVTQIPFFYRQRVTYANLEETDNKKKKKKTVYDIEPSIRYDEHTNECGQIPNTDANKMYRIEKEEIRKKFPFDKGWQEKVVPVYIGVGLRVVARVTVLDANVNLSGLGVIGSEAKAGRLKGSLSVQTLGITGRSVSSALPLPSEINETTIQNAILSIGTIKAQLYSLTPKDEKSETNKDGIVISPRVVGIYKPFKGGAEVINPIISELARQPVRWYRPCKNPAKYPSSCSEKK
ncbi:hypothetical protein [Tenacibaculum jejuense]|uniref:Lipoprotein n=1 Tax=Tenacibaculum jejuense TaxID=584609 RepID=A0A238U907_9FLAO|nr:hypothetical protein [Tenacibaculum jejuense]SNR15535.1 Protein of unknown function [Tenacibaculum jejuense]